MQMPIEPETPPPAPEPHPHSKILVEYLREKPIYSYKELYETCVNEKPFQKKRRGKPFAAIVARKDDNGEIQYGWAHCCKNDVFSKKQAIKVALSRIEKNRHPAMTNEISHALIPFGVRAEHYFNKNKTEG